MNAPTQSKSQGVRRPAFLDKLPFYTVAAARWEAMDSVRRGIALVSLGSLTLVVMATLVKYLGERLPAMEIFFFRSLIGFVLVLAVLWRDPFEPLRTKRPGMHFVRGATGAIGNACFFWTLTNMLLADAMALQFSRPLFMIPLAMIFLGEIVGLASHRRRAGRVPRHRGLCAPVQRGLRARRLRRRARRVRRRSRGDLASSACRPPSRRA